MTEEMPRALELTPINHYASSRLSFFHSKAKSNRIKKGAMINAEYWTSHFKPSISKLYADLVFVFPAVRVWQDV